MYMKKKFLALGLALISLMMMSCGHKANNECFIHYTPDTLDVKTQQVIDFLYSTPLLPKDTAGIDALAARLALRSYDEFGGACPAISEGFTVDTITDAHGWRTLRICKSGVTPKCNFVYIHGGAFIICIDQTHVRLCEAVAERCEAAVYIALYPLAPAVHVMTGLEMLADAYRVALKDGLPVYIMGDSAGANLTLCLTLYLKQLGEILPAAIFPISPLADFTLSNPEIAEVEKRDPMLCRYLGEQTYSWLEEGMSKDDPMVSPIHGDLTNMPPTLMFVGENDILGPDDMLLYEKMKANGNRVGVLYGKGLFHTAPTAPLPVQEQWLDEVDAFMK